jgi:hypothetical protein
VRRWLLVVSIAVYFVAALAWLAFDRRVPRQAFDSFSTENTAPEGTSLAYKYLAGRGRQVAQLTRPIESHAVARDGVVFRLAETHAPLLTADEFPSDDEEDENLTEKSRKKKPAPSAKPKRRKPATPLLSDNEEEWVRGGGRLVLGVAGSYGPLEVRGLTGQQPRKAFPIWPGIDSLTLPEPRALAGADALRHTHALFIAGNETVMARQAIGAGDVILFAAPEVFTNAHLANATNLELLAALAGAKRPVYFDEYVHGLAGDSGLIAMLKEWNLGPFLLLLLVIAGVVFWRGGRAVGKREDDHRETRSDAVDLVASLGALYDRSMLPGEALALYHHELTRAVAAQTRLRGEPLHKRVAELTGGMAVPQKHSKLSPEQFRRILQVLNDSFRRIEHAKHS